MQKISNNNILQVAIIIVTLFLAISCNKPNNVLSKSKMKDFIYDLHKLEGSLAASGLGDVEDRENVYYYNALLKAHGITKAQFDSSLVWYSKDPKDFERIYTDVLERMVELDKDVVARKYHPIDSAALRRTKIELWQDKTSHLITRDSAISQIDFDIYDSSLRWDDKFTFKIQYRLSSSDTIESKKLILRLRYIEGISDSIIVPLTADSILRRYKIRFRANRQLPIEGISGQLLNDTTKKSKFYAKIDSISLTRKYDELAQDSIKTVIELIMQNRTPEVVDSIKIDSTKSDIQKIKNQKTDFQQAKKGMSIKKMDEKVK